MVFATDVRYWVPGWRPRDPSPALEPSTLEKAEEIGKGMRTERGVQNAVCSFHQHLDLRSLRCAICPTRPAVWWHKHLHIKLSAFAAAVLVEAGIVDPHHFEL